MTKLRQNSIAVLALVFGYPRIAWAGMPSFEFTDIARMRLQTISFFLVGLLVSAWVILKIWNSLQKDFPRLPRLTYLKACGIVVLWGLLFIVVLTMISGARELMTPGAWQKDGATYKLKTPPPSPSQPPESEELKLLRRREKLSKLYVQLRKFADDHIGAYPDKDPQDEVAESFWQIDDPAGMRYVYVPGL